MKSRTIFLPPGRVVPGMTLAAAVAGKDGHALLAAGTIVDASILDRLSRRGIEAIAVLLLDTRDAESIAREVHSAQIRVAQIFRGSGSPARDELQSAVVHYRMESTQ